MRTLEEDLKARPWATHEQRREPLFAACRVEVSETTPTGATERGVAQSGVAFWGRWARETLVEDTGEVSSPIVVAVRWRRHWESWVNFVVIARGKRDAGVLRFPARSSPPRNLCASCFITQQKRVLGASNGSPPRRGAQRTPAPAAGSAPPAWPGCSTCGCAPS
jgi:hypothetical protein